MRKGYEGWKPVAWLRRPEWVVHLYWRLRDHLERVRGMTAADAVANLLDNGRQRVGQWEEGVLCLRTVVVENKVYVV